MDRSQRASPFGGGPGGKASWRVQGGALALLPLLALTACENRHNIGPEAWWHAAIGGKIAQQRPPPPGDKDPYPNLATVPPKPAKVDAAAWNRMTAGLLTDRIAASEAAALAPIPTAVPGAPSSAPPPPAQAPAVGQDSGAGASLAATTTAPAQSAPPSIASVATDGARLPPLPVNEPARPNIAPGPPPPAVPVTAAPPVIVPRAPDGTTVDFSARSADLTVDALDQVKTLAAERGDHGIAITGYGDVSQSDTLAQSAAVDLGLRRAQALGTALVAAGVPVRVVRMDAEAAGRGARLRLLQ